MTVIKCDKCKKEIKKGMRIFITFSPFETEGTTTRIKGLKNDGDSWDLCNECCEKLNRELPTL